MIKLYLDTSVISALFDNRNPERQNLDYLLSWNFKHLVRQKTRNVVNMVNTINNLRKIEIITPAEIL